MKYGPEERYEQQKMWDQEPFFEDREVLSQEEIANIKADEKFEEGR